jgi:hypothetical protein
MSDGSSFAGILGASPAGAVAISGSMRLVLARVLTSADDGSQQWGVIATQNGVTVSSSIAVQVIPLSQPPAPPPPVGNYICPGTGASLVTSQGTFTLGDYQGGTGAFVNGVFWYAPAVQIYEDPSGTVFVSTGGFWLQYPDTQNPVHPNPVPPACGAPVSPPPPPPPPIDSQVTLNAPSDLSTRRAQLVQAIWGTQNVPTTVPTVTQNISNPFPSFNVARVDQYVASMSNGQSNTSNFYIANSPNINTAVILNPGHQETCDWTAFSSSYRISTNPSVLQGLLAAGYSVFAMNMPACGDVTTHNALFNSYGTAAMQYFVEPGVQAMNYWDAHFSFAGYCMAGLSGGGWTSAVLPALDARVQISVAVAGSMPGVQFVPGAGGTVYVDDEQDWTPYFSLAGYLDHYCLCAGGPNRQHVQILNYSDDITFGNAQWSNVNWLGVNFQDYYGMDWPTYLSLKMAKPMAAAVAAMTPMNYSLFIDDVATTHQISTWAQSAILTIFGGGTVPGQVT